jgi:uncharacterized protein (TIGR03435 family)
MPKKYRLKTSAVLAFLIAASCSAQTAPGPAFEVASIRPNPRAERPEIQVAPGSLVIRNEPFLDLMQWAFDLPVPQMELPPWFQIECYDIAAKAAGTADEAQLRVMLQKLLADRLGLKTHREPRVVPVYALTVAKGGPKFEESTTEGSFALEQKGMAGLTAHHARMVDLAQSIAREIGRPVVDETGLKGRYEIRLDLASYMARAADGSTSPGKFDMMSLLFSGLQDLLGLKLESRKESVDVLVVDHAEKVPTEN